MTVLVSSTFRQQTSVIYHEGMLLNQIPIGNARLKFIPLCKSQGPLKMLKITGLMFLVYVINMQRYRPNPQRPEQVPGRCFEHSCKSITGS